MSAKFRLFLDSANLEDLKKCLPHPVVYGVTTNPTLLKRGGVDRSQIHEFCDELFDLGAKQIHIQVQQTAAESIIEDALNLVSSGANIVIKIPATREGFVAGSRLAIAQIPITYTAVYTPEQAHFAAMLGADYAAPYLGRLEDSEIDGLSRISAMHDLVKDSKTRLLVASVRTRSAYLALLKLGVGSITIPPNLFEKLIDHQATIDAERAFLEDAAA